MNETVTETDGEVASLQPATRIPYDELVKADPIRFMEGLGIAEEIAAALQPFIRRRRQTRDVDTAPARQETPSDPEVVSATLELIARIRTNPSYQKVREDIGGRKSKDNEQYLSLLDQIEANPDSADGIMVLAASLGEDKRYRDVKTLLTTNATEADQADAPNLRFPNEPKSYRVLALAAEKVQDWATIVYLLAVLKDSDDITSPGEMRCLLHALNRMEQQHNAVDIFDRSKAKMEFLQNLQLAKNYIFALRGSGVNIRERLMRLIEQAIEEGEKEKIILKAIATIFRALNESGLHNVTLEIAEFYRTEYPFYAAEDISLTRAQAQNHLGEYQATIDLLMHPDGRQTRFSSPHHTGALAYAVRCLSRDRIMAAKKSKSTERRRRLAPHP